MDKSVNLEKLMKRLKNLIHGVVKEWRHQLRQPEQLIIKFHDKSTMLVFKSGKFRIMGGIDDLDAHFNIFTVTQLFNCIPEIYLQTMTCVYQYPSKILLPLLANNITSHYTEELFPAVQIRQFKPINVNVFKSGKVIMTGVKDYNVALDIEQKLEMYLLCCALL